MAILLYKSGASAATRRHGNVYYPVTIPTPGLGPPNPAVQFLRPGPVPISRLSIVQNSSNLQLASIAAFWAQLTSADKLSYANIAKPGNTAYQNFVQFNLPSTYAGIEPYSAYPGYASGFTALGIQAIYNPSVAPDYIRMIVVANDTFFDTATVTIAINMLGMIPVTYCTSASSTPGLPAPYPYIPAGSYVFYGTVSGLTHNVWFDVPWPGGFETIMGVLPVVTTYSEGGISANGSFFACQSYVTDGGGRPVNIGGFGPPPSYTPYPASLPVSVSIGFTAAPLGLAIAGTRLQSPADPQPTFTVRKVRNRVG